jgi:hypothetical protein
MNKYSYLWIVQGFYNAWEDLTASESWLEAKTDLKAYRDNEKGVFRLIQRRELNTNKGV